MVHKEGIISDTQSDNLLTMDEAITRLSTTRGTFYRWLRAGRVTGFKIGRQWRFAEAEIDRFLRGEEPRIDLQVSPQRLIDDLVASFGDPTPEPVESALKERDPIRRAVDLMFTCAIMKGAQTFHVDSINLEDDSHSGQSGMLSLRIDGLVHRVATYDIRLHGPIIDRFKQLGAMDLMERRLPQDGRLRTRITPIKSVDFTLSVLPGLFGESLTVRIIDPASVRLGLEVLGLAGESLQCVQTSLAATQGLFIASGPPDSGKTVTAYTILNSFDSRHRRVVSIDEPGLPMDLPGVVQSLTNEGVGLGTLEMMRAASRARPDILFVASLKDEHILREALEMALSRVVITTMQFRDSVMGLIAMRDWGASELIFGDAIGLITAQRLVRRLCDACKVPREPDAQERALIDAVLSIHGVEELDGTWFVPGSCDACNDGYRGRVGLFEALSPSSQIEQALADGLDYVGLQRIAVDQGMETLSLDAVRKSAQGLTSMREIRRVAGDLLQGI